MGEIDARITGFDYTTFHAYTTEVEVHGRTWTLGIRYNTFHEFYIRLLEIEKHFPVEFPPKGGLFFSPPPEERQQQLDEFLLSTLAYFDMRDHPKQMRALLGELLQIPEHLGVKDNDEERTASEGSFEDHDDFRESDHENETPAVAKDDNQVEVVAQVDHDEQSPPADVKDDNQTGERVEVAPVELETKREAVETGFEEMQQVHAEDTVHQQVAGSDMATDNIAMARHQTLVNGAIQAAVVSVMKENVEKSKAAKMEKAEQQEPVKDDKATMVEVEMQQKDDAVAKAEEQQETHTEAVPENAVIEATASSTEPEEHIFEPAVPIKADGGKLGGTEIKPDLTAKESVLTPEIEEESVKEDELSSDEEHEEAAVVPRKEEEKSENPVVSWFRRIGNFTASLSEVEESSAQEAIEKQQEKEKEEEAAAQAEKKAAEEEAAAQAEKKAAEARMKAEEEAKAEAVKAELLRTEQELNLRLKFYRFPVFFQGFNCGVGTSRCVDI